MNVLRTLLPLVGVLALTACEDHAKFHLGDHVKVKLGNTEGIVVVHLRPYVDDLYYLKVPGGSNALDLTTDDASLMMYLRQYGVTEVTPETRKLLDAPGERWHYEGPYYDGQLEIVK
jgi:hypothetical protein